MADYIYIKGFEFIQQESHYGRWAGPWKAKCPGCSITIRVEQGESAADFLDRVYMHGCKN
jgi:hypothetical protein